MNWQPHLTDKTKADISDLSYFWPKRQSRNISSSVLKGLIYVYLLLCLQISASYDVEFSFENDITNNNDFGE